jgi:O-antigen/teichoic acid export membrane protein
VHRSFALDPITRGWAVVTSAGVARLGLGFVASLAIARALGPADFGTYAVLAASVGIVGSLAEGGLTEAAVLRMASVWPRSATLAQQRARAFFWLRLGLCAAIVALGWLLAGPLGQPLIGVDDGLMRWALLGIVATALSGAVSAMLQASGAFARMSSLTLVNTGLTALLAVGLALAHRLDFLAGRCCRRPGHSGCPRLASCLPKGGACCARAAGCGWPACSRCSRPTLRSCCSIAGQRCHWSAHMPWR